MRFLRRTGLTVGVVVLFLATAAYVIYGGGRHQGPGLVSPSRVPPAVLEERSALQQEAVRGLDLEGVREGAILFGDLHSHTTFSADALFRSLPIFYGVLGFICTVICPEPVLVESLSTHSSIREESAART